MRKNRFRAAATQTLARLGDIPHNIGIATRARERGRAPGRRACGAAGVHGHRLSVRFARALPRARRIRAGWTASCRRWRRWRANTASTSPAASPNGIESKQRIFNTGIMLGRKRRGRDPLPQAVPRHARPELVSFGERGCPVVDTDLGRIGLLICFDGRIPEIARSIALQGAEIIVDMANFFAMDQADMWGPARSYENGIWLVAATKAGYERSIYYPGGSMIVDPKGRVVAKMPYDRHGLVVADVIPDQAHDKSIYAGNDKFADRRPATYGILVKNYQDTPVAKIAHEPIVPAQVRQQGRGGADPCHARHRRRRRAGDGRSHRQARRQGYRAAGIRADRDLGADARRRRRAPPTPPPPTSTRSRDIAKRYKLRDRALDRHPRRRPPVRDHRAHRARRRGARPLSQDPPHRGGARLGAPPATAIRCSRRRSAVSAS